MLRPLLTTLIGVMVIALYAEAQCNGHSELCGKRYDEVAYVTTHNAFNAEEEGFNLPNQTYGLTKQLEDGVRGLMLDVYDEGGVATVYHGFSFLGTETLLSNLQEVHDFLAGNPNEVVTIIFECYVDVALMDSNFTEAGLLPYLHEQALGEPWPTLQEMVNSGKQLVVFSDCDDATASQPWYHYVWGFAVETEFSNHQLSDFSCDFNRGDSINDLFILNHFVTDANIGVGLPDQAAEANALDFFYNRAVQCETEKQKFPNFLTVDFYELGQTFIVADSINSVSTTIGIVESSAEPSIILKPNVAAGVYTLRISGNTSSVSVEVYNTSGALVESKRSVGRVSQLDFTQQPSGLYHVAITTPEFRAVRKLVHISR